MVWISRSAETRRPGFRGESLGSDPAGVREEALRTEPAGGVRIIALVNDKGGCGKTTTTVNLAGALGVAGARVLVVDNTPQAHATRALGIAPDSVDRNLYDVLADPTSKASLERIVRHAHPRLNVAPGGTALGAFETRVARDHADRRSERLASALRPAACRYDYILIDCPPNLGALTFGALRAADAVVVPVEASAFALEGLNRVVELVEIFAQRTKRELSVRILATLFDGRTRFARTMLGTLRDRHGERCFDTVIRANVRLREAALDGVPICLHSPTSLGAEDYGALEAEFTATYRDPASPRPPRLAGARAWSSGLSTPPPG